MSGFDVGRHIGRTVSFIQLKRKTLRLGVDPGSLAFESVAMSSWTNPERRILVSETKRFVTIQVGAVGDPSIAR